MATEVQSGQAFVCSRSLLGGWLCYPIDTDPADPDVARVIREAAMCHPKATDEDIFERLWGGFACDIPGRRHAYIGVAHYAFTLEDSAPLDPDSRSCQWHSLLGENSKAGEFLGDGPWSHDAPARGEVD